MRTRRSPPPSSSTALVTMRLGEMSRGIEPGGIAASSITARPPATTEAIADTTTACVTRPANSVLLRAPIALSTPYNASRSTVSRAKKRATTTTPIATVTPMIWLNVWRCCSTPGIASTASVIVSDSVASSVASSIAAARSAGCSSSAICTTSAWNTSSPSCSSGRLAESTSRHVPGSAHNDPWPEYVVSLTNPITVTGVRAGPRRISMPSSTPSAWSTSSAYTSPGAGGSGTPTGASS